MTMMCKKNKGGRPRIGDTIERNIRIEKSDYKRIEELAKVANVSASDVIRLALKCALGSDELAEAVGQKTRLKIGVRGMTLADLQEMTCKLKVIIEKVQLTAANNKKRGDDE